MLPGEWGQPLLVPSIPWVRGQSRVYLVPWDRTGMDFPAEPRGFEGKRSSRGTFNHLLMPQILGTLCWEAAPTLPGELGLLAHPGTNSSPVASSHTPIVTGSYLSSPFPSQPRGTLRGPEPPVLIALSQTSVAFYIFRSFRIMLRGWGPMGKLLPLSQNHRGDAFQSQPLHKFGHKRALKHHEDQELQSPFCPFPRARSRDCPCPTPWNPCPSWALPCNYVPLNEGSTSRAGVSGAATRKKQSNPSGFVGFEVKHLQRKMPFTCQSWSRWESGAGAIGNQSGAGAGGNQASAVLHKPGSF